MFPINYQCLPMARINMINLLRRATVLNSLLQLVFDLYLVIIFISKKNDQKAGRAPKDIF